MSKGNLIDRVKRKIKRTVLGEQNPRLILLNKMPKAAVCGEIGVWKGEFSEQIYEITEPKQLHLIDPWEFQSEFSDRMYGGSVAKNQSDMDSIYQYVKNKFKDCTEIEINRGKSEQILPEFEDNYFDWLYIDGNHYYEYVLKDLHLAFAKVELGGIIAGDDYKWGKKEGLPVQRAVQDFVKEKGLEKNLEIIGNQFVIKL